MTELSDDAKSLIDIATRHDGPTRGDRERVRGAVFASLGTAAVLSSTTAVTQASAATVTATATATSAGAGAGALVKLVSWALVGGGLGLGATLPWLPPTSAPEPARVAAPQAAGAAPQAPPDATVAARDVTEAPAETEEPVLPQARAAAPTLLRPPTPTPRTVTPDSLASESLLLSEAQRALAQGQGETALETLKRHESAFPDGALAPEREAARVFALCTAGNPQQARELAQRFAVDHPTSPLRARVLAACQD